MPTTYPLLYTFRRCPYAIRARMALVYSKIKIDQQEVDLKNKPREMLDASAKGTVPVLIVDEGLVIDESLDIMLWALNQSDPDGWLNPELKNETGQLIQINDANFKLVLDNYKYPQKSKEKDPLYYRDKAEMYLEQLDSLLKNKHYLLSDHVSFVDIAIFPFIRQFCMVDKVWFAQSKYQHLQVWLDSFLNSDLFLTVMRKPA